MVTPIEKFEGRNGKDDYSELLEALDNKKYDATQRAIAQQLINLNPTDPELSTYLSFQSKDIKANLPKHLRLVYVPLIAKKYYDETKRVVETEMRTGSENNLLSRLVNRDRETRFNALQELNRPELALLKVIAESFLVTQEGKDRVIEELLKQNEALRVKSETVVNAFADSDSEDEDNAVESGPLAAKKTSQKMGSSIDEKPLQAGPSQSKAPQPPLAAPASSASAASTSVAPPMLFSSSPGKLAEGSTKLLESPKKQPSPEKRARQEQAYYALQLELGRQRAAAAAQASSSFQTATSSGF